MRNYKVIYWIPRAAAAALMLLTGAITIGPTSPTLTTGQLLGTFAFELIPSLMLLALLLFACRWSYAGGVVYMLLGITFSIMLLMQLWDASAYTYLQSIGITLLATMPFTLVGVLFLAAHQVDKRRHQQTS